MNILALLLFMLLNVFVSCNRPMSWLIDLKRGGPRAAKKIAKKHNLLYKGSVGSVQNMYELESKGDYKSRRRRDNHQVYRSEKEMSHDIQNSLYHEYGVVFVEKLEQLSRKPRGFVAEECCDNFDDPDYPNQWVYQNKLLLDVNIEGAWKQGITGKGVVVAILDDGVEYTHDDLKDNWDKDASFDFTDVDTDPLPRILDDNENRHGTRCAGIVAASANNSKCGVGAAFEANIGGIRMLDGSISDGIECKSLAFKKNHIDIYSMSWGPDDDGKTVDGPKHCAKKALREGTSMGRHGKGSIFVWASGNGGKHNDDCNLDGYVSSIYTIAISAISSSGLAPWYSESCACTLGSAYSSGFNSDKQIVTTDVHNTCTYDHTGTSGAAPLAAGIFALVLQANPDLTWRDMQHLIVRTASKVSNNGENQWTTNGAGLEFHPKLGFGVIDATKMVNMARNWTHVPPHRKCNALKINRTKVIPPLKILNMMTTVYPEDCADKATGRWGEDHLNKLEHVQLYITITTPTRGDIVLKLTSPSGTTSKLLSVRPEDTDHGQRAYIKNWAFMTVNLWDEYPYGKWQLQIINSNQKISHVHQQTKLKKFRLVFYGSGRSAPSEEEHMEEERNTPDSIEEEEEVDMDFDGSTEDTPTEHNAEEEVPPEAISEEDLEVAEYTELVVTVDEATPAKTRNKKRKQN